MPRVQVGKQALEIAMNGNLLDGLLTAGVAVAHSCRGGHCQLCRVACVQGVPDCNDEVARLDEQTYLACQCRVTSDLVLNDADLHAVPVAARLMDVEDLIAGAKRLRVLPERPLRVRPGQSVMLWWAAGEGLLCPIASLDGQDAFLELHLQASPGVDWGRASLHVGPLVSGSLHYDPDWASLNLLLLAEGAGMALLYAILREALRQGHQGRILVLRSAYLERELAHLITQHPQISLWDESLELERPAFRQSMALLCGSPSFVRDRTQRLFWQGVPRTRQLAQILHQSGEHSS